MTTTFRSWALLSCLNWCAKGRGVVSTPALLRGNGWRFSWSLLLTCGVLLGSSATATIAVDVDTIYLPIGVRLTEPSTDYRNVEYRAQSLTASQKTWLEGPTSGNWLRLWSAYGECSGCAVSRVYYVTEGAHASVSSWNRMVGGVSNPSPGAVSTVATFYSVDSSQAGRYNKYMCLGYAPGDGASISSLQRIPDSICPDTPPPQGFACSASIPPILDLGAVLVDKVIRGTTKVTVECTRAAVVTVGPVVLTGADSQGLKGYVGDSTCNQLSDQKSVEVTGAAKGQACLVVEGVFDTVGLKIVPGTITVSFY